MGLRGGAVVPALNATQQRRKRKPDNETLTTTVRKRIAEEYRLAATRYSERFDGKRGGNRAWTKLSGERRRVNLRT